jgi:aminopeptidase N
MRKSYLAAFVALALGACGESTTPAEGIGVATVSRENAAGLTQTYAEFRATQVGNVHYQLAVELDPELDGFSGDNRISFDLYENASDLTIDFLNGDVSGVSVNGVGIEVDYNDSFITVAAAALQAGQNEVVIQFSHRWSDNGSGLYRYDDPDDGRTYLYTDFEPYDANLAFPLFDQPDIKGQFTISVTAPNDWIVISTSKETSVEQTTESTQTWMFPETVRIPSYVMSLHAGPYAVWEDTDFRIPMRLFARQSMAALVTPDTSTWFEYTRAGLDFFEEYYGVDYPYGKYDQLLVPDFNAGAMENAAAVTFTERAFIQRDGWTYKEKKNLAEVILHEMAHQWFGDLVTMKWWNGLWLNETFAEFMGYHAAAAKLGLDDAWEGFFLDRKYVAYWTDQRSTTHPVETPVPDTDSVGANFDMISYAKGASVLRQIEFRLGEDVFRRGINTYLERHAEGNAELQDFVGALAEASGTDLENWAQEWLYTAGANTVEAQYTCIDGSITDFVLLQSAPADYPILRTQRVQVGLLRNIDGVVVTDEVIPVTYSGASTPVVGAIGKACPDIVYPNYGDYGYLLVKLDPRTRSNINAMIGRIEDPFQRVMFWQTLWDNVRFAQIPVTDYLDAVFASAAQEDDINNVDQVYAFVSSAINYLRSMQSQAADVLAEYRPKAEAITWANIERTRGDLQTMYLDRYLSFVSGNVGLERLVDLLTGDTEIPGREFDQDRRWIALRILSAEGHDQVDQLLATEKKRDPSDDGRRRVLAVEAARPEMSVKRAIIDDVLNRESANSYAMQRISMRNMFPAGQEELHEALADEILAQILEEEKNPDPSFYSRARGFAAYLIPTNCTKASVARLKTAVAAHKNSRASIKDYFADRHEDDALCVERAALLN